MQYPILNFKKIIIILTFLFLSHASYGQELFIVHAHKHYVLDNFSSFRKNDFSINLKRINDYFCERNWDNYWIYERGFSFVKGFPVRRCGAKKLRSNWGDITPDSYHFKYTNQVVLTGIYLGNCVSRTYRSIYARFAMDTQSELNVHIPMPATISNYEVLLKDGIDEVINHPNFMILHNLTKNYLLFKTEIYFNNALIKVFEPAVENSSKIVRLQLWDQMDAFMKTMENF